MSLNAIPLSLVNEIPEQFDLKNKKLYSVINGPSEFEIRSFTSNSLSQSQMSFTCHPPSSDTLVYPIIYKKVTFRVYTQATGAAAAGRYGWAQGTTSAADMLTRRKIIAPCANPLTAVTASETLMINGQSVVSGPLGEYQNAFSRFCNDLDDRTGRQSLAPSMLDESHDYSVGVVGTDGTAYTNKDVFAKYNDLGTTQVSRAAFSGCNYAAADATATGGYAALLPYTSVYVDQAANPTANVRCFDFTTTEPVMISPFYYNKSAIGQINTLTYSCQFANLERAVRISGAAALNTAAGMNVLGVVPTSASIMLMFATPKLLEKISRQVSYSYQEITVNSAISNTLAGPAAFNTDAFQCPGTSLESIPRRVIIWCEESDASRVGAGALLEASMIKTNSFKATFDSISITFGNRSGILADANTQMLYHLSKKNGLNMNFSQFDKYIGGVVALDFGIDIPLPDGASVGLSSTTQFSVKGTIRNVSGVQVPIQVKYALIYDGCFNMLNTTVNKNTAVLRSSDILKAQLEAPVMVGESKVDNVFGGRVNDGGAFNPLMLLPIFKMIRGIVQTGAPIAKGIADFGEKIGLGEMIMDAKQDGGKIAGGKIAGKKAKGGKVISRSDLYE